MCNMADEATRFDDEEDWEHSKGATAERARVVELGISVFHGVHGLSNWLHSEG